MPLCLDFRTYTILAPDVATKMPASIGGGGGESGSGGAQEAGHAAGHEADRAARAASGPGVGRKWGQPAWYKGEKLFVGREKGTQGRPGPLSTKISVTSGQVVKNLKKALSTSGPGRGQVAGGRVLHSARKSASNALNYTYSLTAGVDGDTLMMPVSPVPQSPTARACKPRMPL